METRIPVVIGLILCGLVLKRAARAENVGEGSDIASVMSPTADIACMYKTGDEAMPNDFNAGRGFVMIGDYLYLSKGSNRIAGGVIQYFKWNPQTNTLKYAGSVTNSTIKSGMALCVAGGRLYGLAYLVWGATEDNGLTWYDIEPGTGKPIEKGVITNKEIVPLTWGGQLIPDAQGKNIYMAAAGNKWARLKLGADGTPELAGDATGAGIGNGGAQISPDEKHIYSIANHQLAIVDRKPTGEISYRKSISMDVLAAKDTPNVANVGDLIGYIAGISPDGKWLYAMLSSEKIQTKSCFGIFKRDPETGELEFSKGGSSYDKEFDTLANLYGMNLLFNTDGTGGFLASHMQVVQSFRLDAKTGMLSDITDVITPDLRGRPGQRVVFDPKRQFLFGTAEWQYEPYGGAKQGLWSAKIGQTKVRAGRRVDISPTAAAAGDEKPGSTIDWPCWRGPNGDGKNATKGIRTNWTGGLKKIWEVKGLSPFLTTFAPPSVLGNKLIVMGKHGRLDEVFCFDADKGGEPLWIAELFGDVGGDGWSGGPQSQPYISGDKVYVCHAGSRYSCLSMTDGRLLWQREFSTPHHAPGHPVLVWEDLAILTHFLRPDNNKRAELAAVKKDTGELVWTYNEDCKPGNFCWTAPVKMTRNGKDQLLFNALGGVVCLEPRTGKQIWKYAPEKSPPESWILVDPVTDGSKMFVPAAYGDSTKASGLQIENDVAKQLWIKPICLGNTDPILKDDYLFTFNPDGGYSGPNSDFRCIDMNSGDVKWVEKQTGCGTVVEIDGHLLCLTYTGDLWLVDPSPDGFKKIAELKGALKPVPWWTGKGGKEPLPCWTALVVARGKVYLRSSDFLMCYDIIEHGVYLEGVTVKSDTLAFRFKQTGGGLIAANGELKDIVITDAAGAAKPAAAKIDGENVIIDIKDLPVPFGISYAGAGALSGRNQLPAPAFGWNAPRVLKFAKCFDQSILLNSNLSLSAYWSNPANYSIAGAKITSARISAKGVTLTTDKTWTGGDAVILTYPCFHIDQGDPRRETLSFTVPEVVHASAKFVKTDEATSGGWKGVYGSEGAVIQRDAGSTPPKCAVVTPKNQQDHTWADATPDARALQKSGDAKDRIATCWYSGTAFDIDIGMTDSKDHQVALYLMDWDGLGREVKVEIRDVLTDAILDTQSVSDFKNGKYLVWNVKGQTSFHFISTGKENATVSGVFFDPPGPAGK